MQIGWIVIVINVRNKQWTPNEGLSEATFAKSIKQIDLKTAKLRHQMLIKVKAVVLCC